MIVLMVWGSDDDGDDEEDVQTAAVTVSMFAIITNYHCDNRVLHRHGHRRHAWHGHQQLQLDEDVNYSSASCNHHPLHAVSAEMHHAPPPARLPRSIVILPSALGTVPSLPLPGCSSAVGRGSIRWRGCTLGLDVLPWPCRADVCNVEGGNS